MNMNVQHVLGELVRRLGNPIMEDATPEEKKLATRIIIYIHAWMDGQVDEDEVVSLAGSDSSTGSPFVSDDDYDEDEDGSGKPEPTTEDDMKLVSGWMRFSTRLVSPIEMKQALELLYSGVVTPSNPEGKISRGTVQHRHRFLASPGDWKKLKEFEKCQMAKQDRQAGYRRLRDETAKKAVEMIKGGKAIRRRDLLMLATRINNKEQFVKKFRGSNRWLRSLSLRHQLRIKRVTKFVGKRKFREEKDIEQKCKDFVELVKREMTTYPPEAVINFDQTGINRELMVSRYLALPDERQVVRMKLSSNGDRESVTAMPLFRSDGSLHDQLYLQFKEATGQFPKRKGHFAAKNIIAVADKTSIMSYKTFETCLKTYVAPAIAHLPAALLVLDSWKPFLNHAFIRQHLPPTCTVKIYNIPGGGTSICQPADVGLYRQHKLLLKAVHDHVRNFDIDFDIQGRDGIIVTQSLIHRALTHPRFKGFLQYAWHKSGYHVNRPPPYEKPMDVIFPRRLEDPCAALNCSEPVAFVFCVFCNKFYCAVHFFKAYHWC